MCPKQLGGDSYPSDLAYLLLPHSSHTFTHSDTFRHHLIFNPNIKGLECITDGKIEVVNHSLGTLLRVLVKKNLKAWDLLLLNAEFA